VRTVILQRVWTLVVGQFVALEGPISGSGTLEATVEWTLATNDVDIYVTTDACSEQTFALFQCTFLASADSATTKPEHVSLSVTAGAYRVWVVNLGPTEEAGTVEVAITQ